MDYDVLIASNYEQFRAQDRKALETLSGIQSGRIREAASKDEVVRTIDEVIASGGTIGVIATELHLDRAATGAPSNGLVILEYAKRFGIPVIIRASEDPNIFGKYLVKKGAFYVQKKVGIEMDSELAETVKTAISQRKIAPN